MANTVTSTGGTLTLVSGTNYKIRNNKSVGVIFLANFSLGNATDVTLTFFKSYGDSTDQYQVSTKNSSDVLSAFQVKLTSTGYYEIPVEISNSTEYTYVTATWNGGTTATLNLEAYLDKVIPF